MYQEQPTQSVVRHSLVHECTNVSAVHPSQTNSHTNTIVIVYNFQTPIRSLQSIAGYVSSLRAHLSICLLPRIATRISHPTVLFIVFCI